MGCIYFIDCDVAIISNNCGAKVVIFMICVMLGGGKILNFVKISVFRGLQSGIASEYRCQALL